MSKNPKERIVRMTKAQKREALFDAYGNERVKRVGMSSIVKRPIVVVVLRMEDVKGKRWTGIGWAKVTGADVWNPNRGLTIAEGKAIHHVAEQIVGVKRASNFALNLNSDFFNPAPTDAGLSEMDITNVLGPRQAASDDVSTSDKKYLFRETTLTAKEEEEGAPF